MKASSIFSSSSVALSRWSWDLFEVEFQGHQFVIVCPYVFASGKKSGGKKKEAITHINHINIL